MNGGARWAHCCKRHGYHCGAIGKWHLGMGWDFRTTDDYLPPAPNAKPDVDAEPDAADVQATDRQRTLWRDSFSRRISGGPTTRGFDYYFGVDVPNWPPYCYIENDATIGTPSEFLQARPLGDNLASLHQEHRAGCRQRM